MKKRNLRDKNNKYNELYFLSVENKKNIFCSLCSFFWQNTLSYNKKSQLTDYALWWLIFKLGFTITVALIVILLVNEGTKIDTPSRQIDADIIAGTLMFSPALMNINTLNGEVITGNINISKFENQLRTEKELEQLYKIKDNVNYVAMKISLVPYDDLDIILTENTDIEKSAGQKPVYSVYYKKAKYKEWKTFIDAKATKGKGTFSEYNYFFLVTIGQEKVPGYLNVSIIIPNG